MDFSTKILGTAVVTALQTRTARPVLMIGKDAFTRSDLASVTCFNFVAAATLSTCLAPLKLKSTKDLFETIPPAALALPRLGSIALAVLGAAFEAKGLGGDHPLETWMQQHAPAGAKRPIFTTFHTVKARDAKERRAEAKGKKRRQRQRRDAAQQMRVERFAAREGVDVS
jgi:hypothetical protein